MANISQIQTIDSTTYDIRDALAATLSADNATTIPSSADLDTYTTPGNYKCTSNTTAGTLTHCPVATAFRMFVMTSTLSSRYIQIIVVNNMVSRVYMRHYTGSSWYDWSKLLTDNEIPVTKAVTLTAAGWSSNSQTKTVSGVSATETDQLITVTPAAASLAAYKAAGVMATGQAANSITFSCAETPSADLTVYVTIQEVAYS